jgi:hypothetical protein
MENSKFNETAKKVLIVVGPILVVLFVYFRFFYTKEEISDTATISQDALLVPDSKESSELASKTDVYERSDSIRSANELRKNVSHDDFFGGNVQVETKEEVAEEIPKESQFKVELAPVEMESKPVKIAPSKPNSGVPPKDIFASNAPKKTVVAPKKQAKIGFTDDQKRELFGEEIPVAKKEEPKKEVVAEEAPTKRRSFHSSSDIGEKNEKASSSALPNTDDFINCVVHNDQVIKSGSTVRLRITQNCVIDGHQVPKNTYASGIATFQGERVKVVISSLKLGDEIVRTKLNAFERDGIEGIYAPGSIDKEIANQAAQDGSARTSASINVPMFGSVSMGARKKIADPTVKLISNYKLLLKNVTN